MITLSLPLILMWLAAVDKREAFEISTTQDKIWSYVNVTCEKSPKEDHLKLKEDNLLDLYYDFEKSRATRAIDESESKFTKQLQTSNKNRQHKELNEAKYASLAGSNDRSVDEPVVIKESVIKGAERVLLYTNCDTIILKSGSVSDVVNSLFINSDGSLIFNDGWAENNITVLKIHASSLLIHDNCSWLPRGIVQLDIAGVSEINLTSCKSELKMLSLVEAGISKTDFCFPKLESLDVSSNDLQSIKMAEECCGTIRELKASHNKIEDWSQCSYPNLVYISLDHNFLTQLNLSNCSNEKLISIDASYNKISQFPPSLPERLTTLVLSFNQIENITVTENSLKVLDLSHNKIQRLMNGAFRFSWDLSELNLSHNLLIVIRGHDFSGLRLLNILDISHNQIRHIRQKAFSNLAHLETLHLNGNYLHKLDTRLLAYLPKKINFFAHGNPWSCSCYLLAELSKITRSSCAPSCHHQKNKLKCKQGGAWIAAPTILQKCLMAVQSNLEAGFEYPETPQSDEDTSEEKEEMSAVALHSGLILVLLLVVAAITIKMFTGRKWLKKHLCNCLEPTAVQSGKPGNGLTSMATHSLQDSESETEF